MGFAVAMTFGDLLAACWRQRILVVVCLALTAAAVFLASKPVEAWNGRVAVVFLVPEGTKGNAIAPTTASLIAATGIVARSVNGAGDPPQTVSADLKLTSLRADPGWSVRQPNAGGQWDIYYEEPSLDVKSSGNTRDEAAAEMQKALDSIGAALDLLQDEQHVRQDQRIRMQLSPAQPVLTRQSGSRIRSIGAVGLAGIGVTLALVVLRETFGQRRGFRREVRVRSRRSIRTGPVS